MVKFIFRFSIFLDSIGVCSDRNHPSFVNKFLKILYFLLYMVLLYFLRFLLRFRFFNFLGLCLRLGHESSFFLLIWHKKGYLVPCTQDKVFFIIFLSIYQSILFLQKLPTLRYQIYFCVFLYRYKWLYFLTYYHEWF
jgi:hypothetical protein